MKCRCILSACGILFTGNLGLPQDWAKAIELSLKAGELGCAEAYFNLGVQYYNGDGTEIDKKKSKHYLELAAMNGNVKARYDLACVERKAGNHLLASKHFMLAAGAGDKLSLDTVKQGFMDGYITKEEYANTLREYQKSQDEMNSDARDKAQAFYKMLG